MQTLETDHISDIDLQEIKYTNMLSKLKKSLSQLKDELVKSTGQKLITTIETIKAFNRPKDTEQLTLVLTQTYKFLDGQITRNQYDTAIAIIESNTAPLIRTLGHLMIALSIALAIILTPFIPVAFTLIIVLASVTTAILCFYQSKPTELYKEMMDVVDASTSLMKQTTFRDTFLNRLTNPLHLLTKCDIKKCATLWEHSNKSYMFFSSPYRWGRAKTKNQPRSIFELNQLISTWGNFEENAPLSDEDLKSIAKIIDDRAHRNSHSSLNAQGNSSSIFYTMASCKDISSRLPEIVLPETINPLCDKLVELLNTRYKNSMSKSIYADALNYIHKIKALSTYKEQVALIVAVGKTCWIEDMMFYVYDQPSITPDQATDIIDQFLARFIQSVHTCAAHHVMHILFNTMSSFLPCLVGKSSYIFSLADSMSCRSSVVFANKDQLMGAIINELGFIDNEPLEQFTQRILNRYNQQQFGEYIITHEFVEEYLREIIYLEPLIRTESNITP